ncbi:MAG: hypothetical protein SOW56_03600 [Bacteroidaceae bacterium]|nr:hypothetical protein [Bacteroidaceae bacterium]
MSNLFGREFAGSSFDVIFDRFGLKQNLTIGMGIKKATTTHVVAAKWLHLTLFVKYEKKFCASGWA